MCPVLKMGYFWFHVLVAWWILDILLTLVPQKILWSYPVLLWSSQSNDLGESLLSAPSVAEISCTLFGWLDVSRAGMFHVSCFKRCSDLIKL